MSNACSSLSYLGVYMLNWLYCTDVVIFFFYYYYKPTFSLFLQLFFRWPLPEMHGSGRLWNAEVERLHQHKVLRRRHVQHFLKFDIRIWENDNVLKYFWASHFNPVTPADCGCRWTRMYELKPNLLSQTSLDKLKRWMKKSKCLFSFLCL